MVEKRQKVAVKLFDSIRRGDRDSAGGGEWETVSPTTAYPANQTYPTATIRKISTTIIHRYCPTGSTFTNFEPNTPNTLSRTTNNFTTTDVTTATYIQYSTD